VVTELFMIAYLTYHDIREIILSMKSQQRRLNKMRDER
jgi:hypothetical protein